MRCPRLTITRMDASPSPAQVERRSLADLLIEVGPRAPTECAGWTAADLVAHLIVREGRPDTLPGILLPRLAFHTERVRRRTTESVPFTQMVSRFRDGPPKWSLYSLPGADNNANTVEFFVHHEDVRRARPGWRPRPLPPEMEHLLWRRLKIARFVLRKVPVEVIAVRPDGKTLRIAKGAKSGRRRGGRPTPSARVHGPVGELVLWALGRTAVAQVGFTGPADAVRVLTLADWRL